MNFGVIAAVKPHVKAIGAFFGARFFRLAPVSHGHAEALLEKHLRRSGVLPSAFARRPCFMV